MTFDALVYLIVVSVFSFLSGWLLGIERERRRLVKSAAKKGILVTYGPKGLFDD